LCTTEWVNGYNPNVHRKYPRKTSPTSTQPGSIPETTHTSLDTSQLPTHVRSQDSVSASSGLTPGSSVYSASSINPGGDSRGPVGPSANLDFVTFGRSQFADVSMGTILANKDSYINKALNTEAQRQVQDKQAHDDAIHRGLSPAARAAEIYHIQSLLPTKQQLLQIVNYHEQYMLYWSGGVYHAPSFRKTLMKGFSRLGDLELRSLDWRWTALLFSILSATIISSPEGISSSWGYTVSDKVRLARRWGSAVSSCLQLGDYASNYHIHSIQAIINMHASEHLVGSTKEWAIYHSSAIVIARGLGLHR